MDKILPAIAQAMSNVKRITRDNRNEHDKYNFASIDDFLAALNPICAEAGLILHMQETGWEEFSRKGKFGDTYWLRFTFEITAYHISGQSMPPVMRSVEVIRSGAQSYGSAQSYALKQFLRTLLLVPTGDREDADFNPTDEGPVKRRTFTRKDAREADRELGEEEQESGLVQAWSDGIREGLPKGATREQIATAYAAQIVADVRKYKSERGLDRYVASRGGFIEKLREYPALFNDVHEEIAQLRETIGKPVKSEPTAADYLNTSG
jgi:hypothetical protein